MMMMMMMMMTIDEDEILNSGNGKSNPKIAIINAQFEILRNT